jgi:hypothetical protein
MPEELLIASVGESDIPKGQEEQNGLRTSEKATVTVPHLPA